VVEAGKALATSLGGLNGQLTEAAEVAEAQFQAIAGEGGEVEQMAKEIALLNGSIRSATTSGSEPNDLLDRRDLLLDELSEMGQVSVTENNDGTIEVGFGDAATPLVEGTEVNWPQEVVEPKGKLGALLELTRAGGTIESFRTELNAFAESLANSVNAIHTEAGGPAFFSFTAGEGAATLAVAVDAEEVQTAKDGSVGGNDIATAIGALRGGAADRSYASFVTRVGTEMVRSAQRRTNAQALLNTVEERRESVSGVSLDEENDQPDQLPARLRSLGPRDVGARRSAQRLDQPHRKGGPLMTMRVTQGMTSRSILRDLDNSRSRLGTIQREISSTKRISKPSDDPFGTGRTLQLSSELEGFKQYKSNVDDGTGWVTATEASLSHITETLQRARELLVQGGNDSNGQVAREGIAAEIEALTEAVKQEANGTFDGRFIFSGTETETRPYELGASDAYSGNEGSIKRVIGTGVELPINVNIKGLLGEGNAAGDNKLLDVMRDIATDLRGGTEENAETCAAPTSPD